MKRRKYRRFYSNNIVSTVRLSYALKHILALMPGNWLPHDIIQYPETIIFSARLRRPRLVKDYKSQAKKKTRDPLC